MADFNDTTFGLEICDGGPPELCGLHHCPYFDRRCECIETLHSDALDVIRKLQEDKDIAQLIAKAIGLKMPEVTNLTEKPIYKIDT